MGPFRLLAITSWTGGPHNAGEGFRGSAEDGRFIGNWEPAYNFSLWADGTSNVVLIGEKHIPQHAVSTGNTSAGNHWDSLWDGSYVYFVHGDPDLAFGAARLIHIDAARQPVIARGPHDRVQQGSGPNHAVPGGPGGSAPMFGGPHPGVCQFLIGDGSVRAFSTSINFETLYFIADVNSGRAVSLP